MKAGRYSAFGEKLGRCDGIVAMMDNLSNALAEPDGKIMLGGGNPARLHEVADAIDEIIRADLSDNRRFIDLVCNYSSPKGDRETALAIAGYLRSECGWAVTADNIFMCNGSQSALFMVFNMLAGRRIDGGYSKALLPFIPEYIGYEDLFVDGECFTSVRPRVEKTGNQSFRYRVDIDRIVAREDVSCVAISSPSNPTGKCWDEMEFAWIRKFASDNGCPLIFDNAYGRPFPNIQFVPDTLEWDDNMIVSMSLSKLGLPGLRAGVVVANDEFVERLRRINAISQLSPNTIGMHVLKRLIETGMLRKLAVSVVAPFYEERAKWLTAFLKDALEGYPVRIHESSGTMFVWLWMENMAITSEQLYGRLKNRGVLTLSGHHFFIGHKDSAWRHKDECLRLTFSQPMEQLEQGAKIVVDEIRRTFDDERVTAGRLFPDRSTAQV